MAKNAPKTELSPTHSPRWARTTKIIVVVSALILLVFALYLFHGLVRQVVVAAILAYVLTPLFGYMTRYTPIKRTLAVVLVYLLLATAVITISIVLGLEAINQITKIINALPGLIETWTERIITLAETPIVLGPFTIDLLTIDLEPLADQFIGSVQGMLGSGSGILAGVASGTVSTLTVIVFVFIISIYIAVDMPRFGGLIADFAAQPGYRYDAERLTSQFSRIWRAYLRGQVILGLVIGGMVWGSMGALGVQNALALGIISGVLEFLPMIGPLIAAIVAVVVALLQPDNWLGLTPLMYGLVVLVVMIVIQQIENNLLVPRIVGGALDLHPLVVIIGVLAGASVAGVLGAILAAPVMATIKLLGTYGWRKLFDLEPFPDPEPEPEPPPPSLRARFSKRFGRKSAESKPQSDKRRQNEKRAESN